MNGNDASRTDWLGNRVELVYDLARNLETSRTEAVGTPHARTISTVWHATWRRPEAVSEPKRISRFTYNHVGNVLTHSVQATSDLTGASGLSATPIGLARTTTYTYNTVGQVLTITGPRTDVADVTTMTYDVSTGALATMTNALSQTTSFSDFDAHARPRRIATPDGKSVLISYTERGLVNTTSVTAGGATLKTTHNYDAAGLLISVTKPDKSVVTFGYDDAHRLTTISDQLGNKIEYELDITGNRLGERTRDPQGTLVKEVTRAYNTLNMLIMMNGARQ